MKKRKTEVIILPHPGPERLPAKRSNRCAAAGPRDEHRRKFLRVEGTWRSPKGTGGGQDWLEMWAEYEAATFVDPLDQIQGGFPSYVHTIDPEPDARLNTDPWIFHPGFLWTTCRHKALTFDLDKGAIVLFGSKIESDWRIDTVLVVDDRLHGLRGTEFGVEYQSLVWTLVSSSESPVVGVAHSAVAEHYSFVPARVAENGHTPFARPPANDLFHQLRKISDDDVPSLGNAYSLTACWTVNGIDAFWSDMMDLMDQHQLLLGTSFSHPGIRRLPTIGNQIRSCIKPKSVNKDC